MIPLRSIICLTGGLGLRGLLQTKIYTTAPTSKMDCAKGGTGVVPVCQRFLRIAKCRHDPAY
jgi:hypothetical protein